MISIDGYTWDVPCSIERQAEMTPSDISGMLLDKSYFNDVLGTYMKYDLTLAIPPTMEDAYSELYETLTEPVDAHLFVLPYNQGDIELTARVQSIKDILFLSTTQKQYWKGVSFSLIANHPTKKEELGDVIARGMSALPEYRQVPIGTVYVATENGWDVTRYPDADESRY